VKDDGNGATGGGKRAPGAKRATGRPPIGPHKLTAILSGADYGALTEMADELGVPLAEVVRESLRLRLWIHQNAGFRLVLLREDDDGHRTEIEPLLIGSLPAPRR
jgi:hypothetical protein